jgi:hypothetical protein
MRALDLDLLKDGAPAAWVGAALLIAGVAGALVVAAEYLALDEKVAKAQSSLRDAGRGARKKPVLARQKADPQKVALEFQQAREVMTRLQLPWNDLFGSIESARKSNVALLSIESEHDKRRVKIYAEAKDLDAMVGYLGYLRQRPALAEVYLESHELQVKDPQRPVRFVLSASWSPAK